MENSQQKNIERIVLKKPAGTLILPSDLAHMTNVETAKKGLLRMQEKGILMRLAHGIYFIPKTHPKLGILYPSIDEIAQAIAKRDRTTIIPSGAHALNRLGLSEQVPMRAVFLTDGSPREIKIGKRTIKFKKTTPKNLQVKGPISGLVIQALKALGKDRATDEQLKRIRELLNKEDPALLNHDALLAPAWIRKILHDSLHRPKQHESMVRHSRK